MEKYGFFGGSFNPPTLAHLNIAKKAMQELHLDKVFFVPMGNSYHKPELIDETHRYNMLKLLCVNEQNLQVESIELNKEENINTITALSMIQNKYNDSENYFIMGADNFVKLPTWKDSEKLIKNYKYIAFERNDFDINKTIESNNLLNEYKQNVRVLKLDCDNNCSSSIFRNLFKNNDGENIYKYTMPVIVNYIKNNNLYQ